MLSSYPDEQSTKIQGSVQYRPISWEGNQNIMAYWMAYQQNLKSKNAMLINSMASNNGGGGEIRTLGWLPIGGFQDRCLQPLGHPSAMTSTINILAFDVNP